MGQWTKREALISGARLLGPLLALSAPAVGMAPALAQSISLQSLHAMQPVRGNVVGVLQIGPQVHPTVITQSGQANIAGVTQVGGSPAVAIGQSGRANAAYVGQYEGLPSAGRAGMP